QDDQDEAHEVVEEFLHLWAGDVLGKVVGAFEDHLEHVVEAGRHFVGRARTGAQYENQQQNHGPSHQRGHEGVDDAGLVEQELRQSPFCARVWLAGQLDKGQNGLCISDDRAKQDHQEYKDKEYIALLHIAVLSFSSWLICSTVRLALATIHRLMRTMA